MITLFVEFSRIGDDDGHETDLYEHDGIILFVHIVCLVIV